MDSQQKDQIIAASKRYMTDKGMSQAAFARYCDINPSYLSNILNGNYEYKSSNDKVVAIADRYFETMARKVGMSLTVAFWKTVETPQFIEIIETLEDARERGVAKMIIGETGAGKTFSVNKFIEAHPMDTFQIIASNQHKIQEVTEDIGRALGIQLGISHRKAYRMRTINEKLLALQGDGFKPMLIIDEFENATHGVIGLCKAIYDQINNFASLVLVGTPELELKLDKMEQYSYNYPGIPQFRSRLKAGTTYLTPIDTKRHFEAFLEDVQDMELRALLRGRCNNYRELHDYLAPALRRAYEDGVTLTDSYFKTMNQNNNIIYDIRSSQYGRYAR